jgi:threonine dehydrogenase-like Zn-dependent dehydrogenase
LAAVDVGKLFGATVIATASTDEKLAVCKQMGADHVINYTEGFREQVRALTEGRGADVIYDPVGGDVFDESMRCIAPYGRILIVGFPGGRPALAKTNYLLIKDAEIIGFTIGALSRHDPAWAKRNVEHLMGWLSSGRISPYVSHALPLERAAEALQLIIIAKSSARPCWFDFPLRYRTGGHIIQPRRPVLRTRNKWPPMVVMYSVRWSGSPKAQLVGESMPGGIGCVSRTRPLGSQM